MKRWMICLLVLAMAGVASSDTSWTPTNSPPGVGYWDDTANWSVGGVPSGVLPGADEKTQFSSGGGTGAECVVTNTMACGQLVVGDGGNSSYVPSLRIADGGTLNAKLAGGSWCAIGYNRDAYGIVEAGGSFNIGTRLGIALVGATSLLEVYGDVTLTGALQVGTGGDGTLKIYHGGTVSANYPEFGETGSLVDLWGDAVLTYNGDRTNQIAGFVADGIIIGNRLTNNVDYAVVVDAGVTNTVINATASIPNLGGLPISEVTNVLSAFGYIVGDVTYGFVSGALTDHVIGQDPAAGAAPLNPGDPVNVVLQSLSVPDLIGMDFGTASNVLVGMGLTVGTVMTNYVFDTTPESVLEQDPAGGASASPGQAIDMTIMEPLETESVPGELTVDVAGSGNWMNPIIWNGGVVPTRETQGFKVRSFNGDTVTLTNKVAAKTLVLGDGATGARLDIMDGGHFVGGQFGDWCAVGYSSSTILNVYTGGVFECRKNLLYALNGGASSMNIDGGTVWIGDWMSLGNGTVGGSTTTTIKNGGSLICLRFRDQTLHTNGVITVSDGTFAMHGTGRISDIQWGLDNNIIQMAPGYSYTLSNESGDSVLTGFLPGYASWAQSFLPEEIGLENEDYDNDGRDNFYEYALNGDPTDILDLGEEPTFVDVGGGTFQYTHLIRNNDPNLVYTVETKTDLTNPTWTAIPPGQILGTNVTSDVDFDSVVNSIPTTDDETFVRLSIE